MFFQASSTINSFACPKHPKEELNNFCNNSECLLPLCSLCTVEHFELHYKQGTRPDLRNFKSIQLECANRIKSLSESLQLAVKEVKDSYQSLPEILKNDIDKIRQSKEDLNSFINEFYDCQLRGVNSPLKYFEDKLKNIQEEVNGLDRKLCGDGFNEVVKCLQKRNFEQEINQAKGEYTSEVQKIGAESNKKNRKVRVQVDNSILSHIKDKLNEYVHVSKKTPSKTSSENSSIQGKVREGSEVTSASKEIEIDGYAQPSPPTRSQTINLISTAECSLNHNDIQPVLSSTSSDKNKDSFSTPTHEPYKINEQSTAASKDISKISYSGFTNGKGYKNSPNTSQASTFGNGKHTLEKSFGEKGNMGGNNKESVRDVKSVLGMLGMFQKRKTEIENNKPIQAIEIAKSENPSKFQSFQERYQQIQNKVKRNPLAEIQNSEPDITKRVKVDQNELEKFKPKPRSSFHELFIRSKTEMFENGQSNSFGSNIFDSVNLPEKRSERKDNFSPISENLYRRSASLLSKDGIIIDDNDMKQKEGSVAVSSPYHFSQCDPESQDLSGTSHYYDIEPLNTLNGKNSVAISEHISQVGNSMEIEGNNKILPFGNELKNDVNNFKVTMNNYYKPDTKHKLLHFFEWRSRNLHILPLDDIEANLSQVKFTKILLDISFVIPDFHTSLSTPDGEIYLLGGRNAKNHDEKYNQVYTVDFQRKELVKKAPMRYKRDSHAICYNEGYIYVIGGVTFDKEKKKSVLRACERYNVAKDEWTEIARVNMPVCNHCACVFQNKYIFCFGGRCQPEKLSNNIFRYTIEEDSWLCIKLQDSMQIRNKFAMTSQAGCCQINEDNIFVFGGYNENRTASNQSFLFSYSSNSSYNGGLNSLNSTHDDHSNSMLQEGEDKKKDICRIKQLNVKKINSAAPFWDKQVIVNNGKIYCLQNDVAAHNARLVYGNRRRLLIFDGTKWSNVN